MATSRGGRPQWERQQRALAREVDRERREKERAQVAAQKEQRQRYRAGCEAEVERKNAEIERSLD